MAIEQVFTNLNLQTAVAVGRASGVAILAAALADLPVFEYTPTTVKATVTGNGGADKKAVASMLARRLRLSSPPSPADAADALAVALCHIQTARIGASR
jgi:crossover junction endodeoxyribonuclease RuvC